MRKYIALVSFTEEGIKNVKDTGKRAANFSEQAAKLGIKIDETYWTNGEYDLIHIFEAPDETAAAAMSFALGSGGNVRTRTFRAFDLDELTEIIGKAHDLQVRGGPVT
jgi:uncharacterized protein with GYD domain